MMPLFNRQARIHHRKVKIIGRYGATVVLMSFTGQA
jgi:hypothetical protein